MRHGHVMYTAAKESDLGENLTHGSLKNSALAEVFNKVKKLKRAVFVDIKPYLPSNNEPAMFIGTPIYIDNFKKINYILGHLEEIIFLKKLENS